MKFMSGKLLAFTAAVILTPVIVAVWIGAGHGFTLMQRIRMIRLSSVAEGAADQPVIRLNQRSNADDQATIEVAGLNHNSLSRLERANLSSSDWVKVLAVYPGSTVSTDNPPMLGDYRVVNDVLRFTPRFRLVQNLTYTARFDAALFAEKFGPSSPGTPSSAQATIETRMVLSKSAALPQTVVTGIYPSAAELPANQLKLHLLFSAPMNLGEAYRHLRLLDETGREVPRAFLEIDQELWDSSRRRFTLLLDPGRIKRGLRSNLEDGAPLRTGKSYRLMVDREWRDGNGNPLKSGFEKQFAVIGADRSSPDFQHWQIAVPVAGTVEPLRLTFDEPLDRVLLEQMIEVIGTQGRRLEGRIEISKNETEWLFTPEMPWQAGDYRIYIDTRMEDRAGNNLKNLFDLDLGQQAARRLPQGYIDRHFVVAGRPDQP